MVLCHGGEKDATIPASALEEKRVEEAVRRLETQKKDLFFFKKKFYGTREYLDASQRRKKCGFEHAKSTRTLTADFQVTSPLTVERPMMDLFGLC